MKQKVDRLLQRLDIVEEELGKPDILSDQKRYREFTQEHSYLSDVRFCWEELQKFDKELVENRQLLQEESDEEFLQVLNDEIPKLEEKVEHLKTQLQVLLVPPDPDDHRNTLLEIRAGTGGDEAALFVADCVRMYRLFADQQGWSYDQLSCTPSVMGGFKEFVMVLSGKNVYRFLKHEAGTHRVQRVPETEAQGRVHTSAATVAVLPEPDEAEEVKVDEKDIRIDTFRASGAGGQHVNVTDSAVRITHLPTGIVVACQDERSQRQNKEKAMRYLMTKLSEIERQQKEQEMASTRALQVGSGDRSERIRTYNFPQNRITDHRINLTKYNLDQVMEGNLEEIVSELVAHYYQQKLSE